VNTAVVRSASTPLEGEEPCDALAAEAVERVELRLIEGGPLRGPLDLHEALRPGHHDVHVDLGRRVLLVVEIDDGGPEHDAHAGREQVAHGLPQELAALPELLDRVGERHVAAGDHGRAGPAVGLDHVAVDGDRALARAA